MNKVACEALLFEGSLVYCSSRESSCGFNFVVGLVASKDRLGRLTYMRSLSDEFFNRTDGVALGVPVWGCV